MTVRTIENFTKLLNEKGTLLLVVVLHMIIWTQCKTVVLLERFQ